MAIIPGGQQIRTIDASVDMTERGSALINSKSEVYTMDDIVETVGGGTIPILTEYPNTDATKVGQKFIYKGNEWKYHSQAELDDLGWTTVSEGFPAPVNKSYNISVIYSDFYSFGNSGIVGGNTLDFLGYGNPALVKFFPGGAPNIGTRNITLMRNVELLLNLEDVGTQSALSLTNSNMSTETINDFFTQLPNTNKTATIDVRSNPGALTCDPTIATAKGYTVTT